MIFSCLFNNLDKNSNNQTAQQAPPQQTPLTTAASTSTSTTPIVSLSENTSSSGNLQFYFEILYNFHIK